MSPPPPPPPPNPPQPSTIPSSCCNEQIGVLDPNNLPPHLQRMYIQVERQQQKDGGMEQYRPNHGQWNQQPRVRGRGGRGRGGGRGGRGHRSGRGRGGSNYSPHGGRFQQAFKRKRDDSGDDTKDPARFFVPSCLEDPWKHLLARHGQQESSEAQSEAQQDEEHPQHQQYDPIQKDRPGRVLFHPSFLMDPWQSILA